MKQSAKGMRRNVAGCSSCRGAILVIVLGMFLLMAILATRFLEAAYLRIRAEALQSGKDELRATAYSVMQATLAVLNEYREIDGGLYSPAQGWGDPLGEAGLAWPEGLSIEISIEDETGKLPLDPFPEEQMRLLFEEMGIGLSDVDVLVDSFLDWTDGDDLERLHGAESAYYQRMDPPRTPPNAPIRSYGDLRYIRGFEELFFDANGQPNEFHHNFTRATSLHHSGQVNLNTASPLVLAVFARQAGFDVIAFGEHLSGRDRISGTAEDLWIRSSGDLTAAGLPGNIAGAGYQVEVLKINIKVAYGEKSTLLSAVIRVGNETAAGGGATAAGQGAAGGTPPATAARAPQARVLRGNRPSAAPTSGTAYGNGGNFPFQILRVAESVRM